MAKSGDSPQATQRRVWRFVFACLFVVLVVGLWPVKGYRIDDDVRFVESLDSPYIRTQYVGALGGIPDDFKNKPVSFEGHNLRSAQEARLLLSRLVLWKRSDLGWDGSVGWVPESLPDLLTIMVRRRNLVCTIHVNECKPSLFPGKPRDEIARECLAAIRDGLDREVPGFTTFYNPPARQLWIDRVRPFLKEQFPKAFAP